MKSRKYEILIKTLKWRSRRIQDEDLKIWDSSQIYDSDRISGATDKGMNTKAHDVGTPEAYSGSSPWKLGLR
jgi:hypothetical protein